MKLSRLFSVVFPVFCLASIGLVIPVANGEKTPGAVPPSRIAGENRIETAVKVAQTFWTHPEVAFVARFDVAADALAAGSLDEGPILLARPDGIGNEASLNYLKKTTPRKIVALGGEAAVPQAILDAFAAAGGATATERIQGPSRMDTSVQIAQRATKNVCPRQIFLAGANGRDGQGSPDPVAAGALRDPLLLISETSGPTPSQKEYLDRCSSQGTTVVQLGGKDLHYEVSNQIAGADRYETASRIASGIQLESLWDWPGQGRPDLTQSPKPDSEFRVILARGDAFADAIVAGSVPNAVILLTKSSELPDVTGWHLSSLNGKKIFIFGGETAISSAVAQEVIEAQSGDWTPKRLRPTIDNPSLCPTVRKDWENNGLNPIALTGLRCVARDIGGFNWISGRRGDSTKDRGEHPLGLAIDLPVSGAGAWSSQAAIDYGNRIVSYFMANGELLNVKYIIFRNTIYLAPSFEPSLMKDPGAVTNPTLDHFDHVHVSFFDPNAPEEGWNEDPGMAS